MRSCLLSVIVALCAGPLFAENWPGFRGPTGQGISAETGLPTRWSKTDNIAWKAATAGAGWSSPIVFDDRVFVTATTEDGVSCHVICLARQTGQILWDTEVFRQTPAQVAGQNSHATPTPVTDGQRVYAFFSGGNAAAVAIDGKVAWTNRELRFHSVHGMGVSPILYRNLLIIPFDCTSDGPDKALGHTKPWDKSCVLALDKNTGKVQWKATRGLSRVAHVTPQVVTVDGRPQLVSGAGDVVQGFDPDTGTRIWSATSTGEGVVPSIVFGDGLIFTASGFGKPAIRAIRPGGSGDVTKTHVAWEQTKAVPMVPSFVFVNHCLYSITEEGMILCLKADSGEIVWQKRIEGSFHASPVCGDGRIYFLSEDGKTTIIEAGREFKPITQNDLGEPCQASPAISHGQLFIRSQRNLYCIGR